MSSKKQLFDDYYAPLMELATEPLEAVACAIPHRTKAQMLMSFVLKQLRGVRIFQTHPAAFVGLSKNKFHYFEFKGGKNTQHMDFDLGAMANKHTEKVGGIPGWLSGKLGYHRLSFEVDGVPYAFHAMLVAGLVSNIHLGFSRDHDEAAVQMELNQKFLNEFGG